MSTKSKLINTNQKLNSNNIKLMVIKIKEDEGWCGGNYEKTKNTY